MTCIWRTPCFCEGPSDYSYFEVLLPRVMESTVLRLGRLPVDVPERPATRLGGRGRTVEAVAAEACSRLDAFHIVFVHADTGGRGQVATVDHRSRAYCEKMHELCELRSERCVLLRPASMTEAWALADPQAVLDTLGYRGTPSELGLRADAEQAEAHPDPRHASTRRFGRCGAPDGPAAIPFCPPSPSASRWTSWDDLGRFRSSRSACRGRCTIWVSWTGPGADSTSPTGRREAARPRCSVRTLSSRATPSSKRVNQRRAASQQLHLVFCSSKRYLVLAPAEAVDAVPMHASAVGRNGREADRDVVADETLRHVGARLKLGGNLAGSGRPALQFQRDHPPGCIAVIVEVQIVATPLVGRPRRVGVVHVDQAVPPWQPVELDLAAFLAAALRAALGTHAGIDTRHQRIHCSAAFSARLDIRAQSL